MGYEIYTEHPESESRRKQNWNNWLFWSKKHAPWTGVSIPDVAQLLTAIGDDESLTGVYDKLNQGGRLTPKEARQLLGHADAAMTAQIRHIFTAAVDNGYEVQVLFSQSAFDMRASTYLAKHGPSA
jgi:hypothetical protein